MQKIWEVFPKLAAAVCEDHLKEGMTGSGHDFEHAARVGQYAYLVAYYNALNICPVDEAESWARLAGAAGLCHNADRILQRRVGIDRLSNNVSEEEIWMLIRRWFGEEGDIFYTKSSYPNYYDLPELEKTNLVVKAVLGHNGKNDESDSPVLVALMDADRLVNIELDLVIRCGQFQPDLPAVDFRHLLDDPTASYKDPKSVLSDIKSSLEWETDPRFALRTPTAIEMGRARFAALRFYMETLLEQIKESGLIPYPFA